MDRLVTLLLETGQDPPPAATPAAGFDLRPTRHSDVHALGQLYFDSYDPGQASASLPEAIADIEASFTGDYGQLWPDASLVATAGGQQLAAAILVVRRAPWPDTPDCPFVIELFTARQHRRLGLARCLLRGAIDVVAADGARTLALRVADDNAGALGLYRSLGFRQWSPDQPVTGE